MHIPHQDPELQAVVSAEAGVLRGLGDATVTTTKMMTHSFLRADIRGRLIVLKNTHRELQLYTQIVFEF